MSRRRGRSAVPARTGSALATRLAVLLVFLAIGAMLPACNGEPTDGLPSQPHPIIVLDIETLRADHLGCYGYERDTSPHIDEFASESILFEWSFSQAPNTAPSQASILTGLYPGTHGVVSEESRLPAEATTLAEALSDRGYVTAAFVDGGFLSSEFGLDQGFDVFNNYRGGGLAAIGPKVMAWIKENASETFLVLVHTYDPHVPYAPPETHRGLFLEGLAPPSEGFEASAAWLERVDRPVEGRHSPALPPRDLEYATALYDAEIRFVDDWIGRLMQELRTLGLDERATIVLVSDHGEEFQEHGSMLHDRLYTTVTRVPMMIRLPGGNRAGRISRLVESIDLMPTLLDLSGAARPPGIQGESLLPLVRGEGTPPYIAYGESSYFGGQASIAMGGYQMILAEDTGGVELYNFLDDPLETRDLAASDPDRVEVLRRKLEAWRQLVSEARLGQEAAPLDEDTLEQLKSLGYIQ